MTQQQVSNSSRDTRGMEWKKSLSADFIINDMEVIAVEPVREDRQIKVYFSWGGVHIAL